MEGNNTPPTTADISRVVRLPPITDTKLHPRHVAVVALVLGVPHSLRDALTVVALTQHLGQQTGSVDEVSGLLGEEVVKRLVYGAKAQPHGELLGYGKEITDMLGASGVYRASQALA